MCAASYLSFRSNVAQRRGESSCAKGQTRSRKGPEPVQLYENCPRPVRVAMDRFGTGFLNRLAARFILRSCLRQAGPERGIEGWRRRRVFSSRGTSYICGEKFKSAKSKSAPLQDCRDAAPVNSTTFVWWCGRVCHPPPLKSQGRVGWCGKMAHPPPVTREGVVPGAGHETPARRGVTRSLTCSGVKGLRR